MTVEIDRVMSEFEDYLHGLSDTDVYTVLASLRHQFTQLLDELSESVDRGELSRFVALHTQLLATEHEIDARTPEAELP